MKRELVIGSRGSKLALWQSEHVAALLRAADPDLQVRIEVIATKGDKILDVSLSKIGGKGVFTKEIEEALYDRRVDIAVHSLKDLPTEPPEGLTIAAIPKRATPLDALVAPGYLGLELLPDGARVGTSSLRRRAQLLAANPTLQVSDLRGNVQTRLAKVHAGEFDAAILAAAGLERLGLDEEIAELLPPEVMLPACGQGALAVQVRSEDTDLTGRIRAIHDPIAAAETTAERAFLHALGGGCQVPIGGLARVDGVGDGAKLSFVGCVCALDGETVIRVEDGGAIGEAEAIGRRAADAARKRGADAIVAAVYGADTPRPSAP